MDGVNSLVKKCVRKRDSEKKREERRKKEKGERERVGFESEERWTKTTRVLGYKVRGSACYFRSSTHYTHHTHVYCSEIRIACVLIVTTRSLSYYVR